MLKLLDLSKLLGGLVKIDTLISLKPQPNPSHATAKRWCYHITNLWIWMLIKVLKTCFMLAEGPGLLSRPPLDVGKRVLMRGGCQSCYWWGERGRSRLREGMKLSSCASPLQIASECRHLWKSTYCYKQLGLGVANHFALKGSFFIDVDWHFRCSLDACHILFLLAQYVLV